MILGQAENCVPGTEREVNVVHGKIEREGRMIEEHLAAFAESALGIHPRKIVFEIRMGDDHALRFTGAPAREKDVKWIIRRKRFALVFRGSGSHNLHDFCRREHHFHPGNLHHAFHALHGRHVINRHIGTSRFYRGNECDKHAGFLVSTHCDRAALFPELRIEPRRESVALCEQLPIGHPRFAAEMGDPIRGGAAEVLNSLEQIHAKTPHRRIRESRNFPAHKAPPMR